MKWINGLQAGLAAALLVGAGCDLRGGLSTAPAWTSSTARSSPATAPQPPGSPTTTRPSAPTARQLPPGPLPDLTVIGVAIDPPPTVRADGVQLLHRGMTYTFRAEVKNVGPGGHGAAVVVGAPYSIPGRGVRPNLLHAGHGLAPGESRLSEPFSVTLRFDSGGKCTFRFKADPDNVFPEADDTDASNELVLTFDVP
jgi:hypothetical protein